MRKKRPEMLNKRASKPKNKADQIMETLSLKPGQIVADVGSGGGYFTYRFAKAISDKGKVYAVDTNQEFLAFITKQATEQGLTNIVTRHTASEHPDLPKNTFDFVFMRNVSHHLPNRVEYFQRLKEALKPEGKIVIIEYDGRGGFFSFQRLHHHYVPQNVLLEEMKQAGYSIQKSYNFLSEQSFTIFSIKND
jgi:ubiquinone/menaquinone biosynthesis C-methylase UbiE